MPREKKKDFEFKGRLIFFATGNVNKFREARDVLTVYGIAVGMLRVKSLEIQSESLKEIAIASVVDAYRRCRLPIIVEDAGLFVDALTGFPGPYAAYVYKTIGNQGLLQLLKDERNRKAHFESIVAYLAAESKSPVCFHGRVDGEIVKEERRSGNDGGFGFDPVFKPSTSSKTFAEMTLSEKNQRSHRAQALRSFGKWYRG